MSRPSDPTAVDRASRRLTMAVVMIATFMAALDTSIVNVALPRIGAELHADVRVVQWVVASYLLAVSSLLLVFGRLADARGYASLMGIGFGVFGVSSLLCGLAGSLPVLVGARVTQGLGASMLVSSGPALVTTTYGANERGRALGLQATATYVGLSLGPSIGGFITTHASWHFVFLINLPIALAGLSVVVFGLRKRVQPPRHAHRFDLLGAALFSAMLITLLVGLSRSARPGWSADVLALLGSSVALAALFLYRQRRAPEPLLPLGLFGERAFSAGVAAAYLQYLVLFVAWFAVPFYLQIGLGMTPARAGLIMTAQPATMVLFTAPSGWLSDHVGPRPFATAGMAIIGVALWLLAGLDVAPTEWRAAAALALLGVGVGLFTTPNNSAVMGVAPRERQGIAASVLATARIVGMMSGVATGANLLSAFRSRLSAAGAPPSQALAGAFHRALLAAAVLALAGAALSLFRPEARRTTPPI